MPRSLALALLGVVALGASDANAQNRPIYREYSSSYRYDPFSDTHFVDNDRHTVRESALDWDRHHMDPGSFRYVDRIVCDGSGCNVREYGYVWTTNGKPHGKLTRERITVSRPHNVHWRNRDTVVFSRPGGSPGTVHRDRDTVVFNRRPKHVQRDRDTVIFSQPKRSGKTVQRNRDIVTFSRP